MPQPYRRHRTEESQHNPSVATTRPEPARPKLPRNPTPAPKPGRPTQCQPRKMGLAEGVPSVAHWRLSGLPQHLEPHQVRALFDRLAARTQHPGQGAPTSRSSVRCWRPTGSREQRGSRIPVRDARRGPWSVEPVASPTATSGAGSLCMAGAESSRSDPAAKLPPVVQSSTQKESRSTISIQSMRLTSDEESSSSRSLGRLHGRLSGLATRTHIRSGAMRESRD